MRAPRPTATPLAATRLAAARLAAPRLAPPSLAAALILAALPARAADLTLRRVMLSAAGVGYFEFAAATDGAATLGLDVPLDEVDDVLRSLAVFDDHGGVGSIELPGRDDTHQAFADVPFGQAMLDDPAELLASLRGEEITVAGAEAMTGRIVSAVPEPLAMPKDSADFQRAPATRTRVTLLTADGFRQFILEDADSVRPTDPALRTRIEAALAAARQQTAASVRHLALRTQGDGQRQVSVGYVVAAPLWKASYRLVLPQDGDPSKQGGGKARVQGWAVLENQSGADWKGVDLTLHSGNPVTFHQAIYSLYYADRPEVPVDVLGRILPDADERVIVKHQGMLMNGKNNPASSYPETWGSDGSIAGARRVHQRMPPPSGAFVGAEAYVPPPEIAIGSAQAALAPAPEYPTELATPQNAAAAEDSVLDTSFHIPTPVDLARGHTASVPILDNRMPAEQVDWLQASSTRPISAIRLTNDSQASLPPGVLTLYTTGPNGAAFAGDARLSGLPAGETRLLGFAEDLRTTATRSSSPAPSMTLHVTVAKGVMRRALRQRIVYTVDLTAPVHDKRRVLVEFPKRPDAKFSMADGAMPGQEETANAWRVPVDLRPGETRHLTAYADIIEQTSSSLLLQGGLDSYVLMMLYTDRTLDAAARAKLQPIFALRDTLADKQAALKTLTDKQSDTTADEARIRENLRAVTGPGNLHEKLLAALDADETTLFSLHADIAKAQAAVDAARSALVGAVEKVEI